MARRRKSYRRAKTLLGGASVAQIMGVVTPQMVTNMNQGSYLGGYDVLGPAMASDWQNAGRNLAANEVLLFTGYDPLAHKFRPEYPIFNYGMMMLPAIVKKFTGGRGVKIGPVRIL